MAMILFWKGRRRSRRRYTTRHTHTFARRGRKGAHIGQNKRRLLVLFRMSPLRRRLRLTSEGSECSDQ
jgi:hypothetical protein